MKFRIAVCCICVHMQECIDLILDANKSAKAAATRNVSICCVNTEPKIGNNSAKMIGDGKNKPNTNREPNTCKHFERVSNENLFTKAKL